MPPPTRRELVLSALQRGKEQSKKYEFAPSETAPARFGTVAVVMENSRYLVVIQEVWSPSKASFMEYDISDMLVLPSLIALEELLIARLRLQLEDLGPSRGIRKIPR